MWNARDSQGEVSVFLWERKTIYFFNLESETLKFFLKMRVRDFQTGRDKDVNYNWKEREKKEIRLWDSFMKKSRLWNTHNL